MSSATTPSAALLPRAHYQLHADGRERRGGLPSRNGHLGERAGLRAGEACRAHPSAYRLLQLSPTVNWTLTPNPEDSYLPVAQ